MQVRVYNDFKRRLLNGEVSADFPCTAILLNSAFDAMYDHAAYFRSVADFQAYSANSLKYSDWLFYGDRYTGNLLAHGNVLETTYYRDTNLNEEDTDNSDIMIVTSANSAEYAPMYARGNEQQNARFADYIDKYGYFYLVARADDFNTLVSRTQSLNMERFVVVLADNIEHVDVAGSCFGCSREYPFRGIFDGNGYALCLHSMQIDSRSNGIFGYISDEAIVRNLIISADATELDDTDSEILVTNTEQISLNTLKAGLGDVKFGVLAGTNNGTVENVLINAKLRYSDDFTPSFCFVQNKTDYPSTLIGGGWTSLSSKTMSAVTGLSAFDNICYPTSLCLNSEANLIPYIGYFNEGSFNTQTVPYDVVNGNPLYTNTRKDDSTNLSYLADIYDLYKAKGNAYHSVENYLEVLGNKSMGRNGVMENHDVSLSYRLGPNNKQAYLLGGMFGLNNGDISQCVCDVQMKFDDNFVALVGGVAGRGARGNIKNVAARAKFIGTSGVYNHDYQMTNEKLKNAPASSMFVASSYMRNSYSGTALQELSPTPLTHFSFEWYHDTDELRDVIPNWGTLTVADSNFGSRALNIDTRGTLTLIGSGYQLTNTEAQQTDIDLSGKDVCFIYNYDITDEYFEPSGANMPETFTTVKFMAPMDGWSGLWEYSWHGSTSDRISLHQRLSNYSLYAISSRTTGGIKLLTSETTLLIASAAQNSHCTINQNNKINVHDLTLRSEFARCDVFYPSDYYTWVGAVSGAVTFNLSAYNVYVTFEQTDENIRALSTMQEEDDVNIRLAPVFNMGGMFGEYIYSNDQSVNSAYVCAEASGFKWHTSANNKTRGFSKFNNVSHFASNVVIDSSNKSNSDMFTSSWAASANARVKNDLNFRIANVTSYEMRDIDHMITSVNGISSVYDSDDCTSGIRAFNTLNIYNHITPSVVTTNYTDHDDADIGDDDGTAPNLGITWLDQLFYSYGLNMGYNRIPAASDAEGYEEPFKQYNNPSACSGWYFNFPAQGRKFYGINYYDGRSPSASNDDIYGVYDTRLWHYDKIFSAVFGIDTPHDITGTYYERSNLYVTKQLTAYPNNYPLYRGRASIGAVIGSLTYDQSAYLTVPVTVPMTVYSAIDDKKTELFEQSNLLHSNKTTESYIYEYTQNIYSKQLPQLSTHVYSVFGSFTSFATKTDVENAYVISSDSYEDIYKQNRCAELSINAGTCDIVVPSSGFGSQFTLDINGANMTECATGAIVKFNISQEYLGAEKPVLELRDTNCYLSSAVDNGYTNIYTMKPEVSQSANMTLYEDKLYVTYPFIIPKFGVDTYLSIPMKLSYTREGQTRASYTTAYIPISCTTVNTSARVIKLDNSTRNDNILSANTLCFGFVPTEEDIISALNTDTNAKAYARTLSSDDISYMLLLDDQQRPIVDMKFDTTAVASAGFYVELESLRKNPTDKSLSAGLLINITK